MISLILPPKSQIPMTNKMLADEYGTASNIKSRVNRLSVLSAITSAQQRLKLYSRCPENGLVIYSGEVMTDDGKVKKVSIDFEPFKPINTSLYMCDNRFHTEALSDLLQDEARFGFIVMDGQGTLFGSVQGNSRDILQKISVDLPKKHGRGGQSSVRFARLRIEKRHNYMRKVGELAVTHFIPDGEKPNIKGLVLAGAADLKNELVTNGLLDARLVPIIVKSVDTSYGGENGFNQAIALAADSLANVKFTEERGLIQRFFDEITMDSGKYCFGIKDSFTALEMSSVETLIVWEDMDTQRVELKHPSTGSIKVLHLTKEESEKEKGAAFKDAETGVELEVVEKIPLTEWLALHYKDFGAKLEFVTNKSQEGSQFVKGFGGIGGVLRWKVDFLTMADHAEAAEKALAATAAARASSEGRGVGGAGAAMGGAGAGGFGDLEDADEDGREGDDAEEPTPATYEEELDFM